MLLRSVFGNTYTFSVNFYCGFDARYAREAVEVGVWDGMGWNGNKRVWDIRWSFIMNLFPERGVQ